MIGRWLFRLALVPIAGLATVVQLDQQSGREPSWAYAVPDAVSAQAARGRAGAAMRSGAGAEALANAQQQLALRPMPAEGLTLLGLAAIANGDQDLALRALGAASERGWREPIAQLASGEAALQQGDHTVAARRAAALLATGTLTDPALALLARLLATPDGRAAFARQLAAGGHWQGNALTAATTAVAPAEWSDTIARAMEQGADLPCDRLRALSAIYERDNETAAASRVLPDRCF